MIPRSALKAIGGISGALEIHANATLAKIAEHNAFAPVAARTLLLALTTPQGTRATVSESLLKQKVDPELATAIIADLEHARLIVREPSGITLAHEALLTQWRRLRSWIFEAREDRLLADEIEREAASWLLEERNPERVWKKRRLLAAEELTRAVGDLSDEARAFVRAGRQAERRGRLALIGAAGALAIGAALSGAAALDGYIQQSAAEIERRMNVDHEASLARQAAAYEHRVQEERTRADEAETRAATTLEKECAVRRATLR